MRNVLRNTCSRAAERLAPSIAIALRFKDPNTMAAMTATSAVANRTSTSVKPASEAGRGRKHICTGLKHFIGGSLLPKNLDLHLANGRQRGRGNDALPSVAHSPVLNVKGHLIARRRIAEVTGGFADGIDGTQLRFNEFFLRQHGRGG